MFTLTKFNDQSFRNPFEELRSTVDGINNEIFFHNSCIVFKTNVIFLSNIALGYIVGKVGVFNYSWPNNFVVAACSTMGIISTVNYLASRFFEKQNRDFISDIQKRFNKKSESFDLDIQNAVRNISINRGWLFQTVNPIEKDSFHAIEERLTAYYFIKKWISSIFS